LALLEWPRLCQQLAAFAATELGAGAARQLQPPQARAQSERLLAQTQDIRTLEAQLTEAQWSFAGIEAVGDTLERARKGSLLAPQEPLDVATTLAGVRRLRRTIESLEAGTVPAIAEVVAQLRTHPELERTIRHCIDEDGRVADQASDRLSELRAQIAALRERIERTLQQILQQHRSDIQDPIVTERGDRPVIPVKADRQGAIAGIVHDTSNTGATLYLEPQAVVGLGNQQRQYRRQERAEQERILRHLGQQIAAVKPDLDAVLEAATELDLATARAHYSDWLAATPPQLSDASAQDAIVLRGLRHPLLVWQAHREQGPAVVPIDIEIRPAVRAVAITGPNTGGKTVALKTLGLVALMAKAGLFVPAQEPVVLPWFERVLADIGDEQSLSQNLSTFSSHIRRIVRILDALPECGRGREAPLPALVLLDEIGAGTDPSEGSALAAALLRYLADRVRLAMATTHCGELKALKYQDERFENASVEFDGSTLAPTYRLLWGIPGRSNALTIAQRLGLAPEILEQAQQQLAGGSQAIDRTIAGLEAQRKQQERQAQEASEVLARAEQLYGEMSERAAALRAREQALQQAREREIDEAVEAAKAEIAQVVRELQQGSKTGHDVQKATQAVDAIAERHRAQATADAVQTGDYRPQAGDRVRIPRLDRTAEILSDPAQGDAVTVRFGMMKMQVPLSDIESLDGRKAAAPAPPPDPPSPAAEESAPLTLDLRGSRIADARAQLETAIAQHPGPLRIVHGKGTGRLRQGVHAFLAEHPQIAQFELAPPEEGGDGVTITHPAGEAALS